MKPITTFLLLILPILTFGQISLENNYSNIEAIRGFTADGNDFYFIRKTNSFEIYTPSHSLSQSISPTLSSGYEIQNGYFPSKTLFDTDNGFEVYVISYNSSSGDYESYIVNEDGSILKDFGNQYFFPRVRNMDGNAKLILSSNTNSEGRVYDLPGTWSGMQEPSGGDMLTPGSPYPNPTKDFIRLNYDLGESSSGILRVFNSKGEQVEKVQIGDAFDHYRFDASKLPAGSYLYKVETDKQVSKGKKFIVK